MATTKTFTSGLESFLPMLLANNSSNTQTSTSTANTAPLQAVYDRASTPMTSDLYQNMITSIFQNAQKNVPGMTAALANATGSRSSNNSPLALALNEQNNQASAAAAQAILAQQNAQAGIAANAANGIAQATRSTNTTTQNKAGGSVDPLTGLLGGFLLNQADKKGWMDKGLDFAGNALGDVFSSPSSTSDPLSAFLQLNDNFGTSAGASFADAGTSFSMPDFGSSFADAGAGVGAGFMDFLPDWDTVSSGVGDFFGNIGSFFGFADGGQVQQARGQGIMGSRTNVIDGAVEAATNGRDPNEAVKMILASALTPKTANIDPSILGFLQYLTNTGSGVKRNQYADGGTIRNRNNMGAPQQRYGMNSLDVSSVPNLGGNAGTNSNALLQMLTNSADTRQLTNGNARSSGGRAVDNGWHDTPAGKLNFAMGNPTGNKVAAGLTGTMMGLVGGSPMGMLVNYLGSGGNMSKAMKTPSSPIALLGEMVKQGWAGKKAGDELGKDTGDGSPYQAAMGQTVGGINMDSMTSNALTKAANAISYLDGSGKQGALDALIRGVNMRSDQQAMNLDNASDIAVRNPDGTITITAAPAPAPAPAPASSSSYTSPGSNVDGLSAFLSLNDNFGTGGWSGSSSGSSQSASENAGTAASSSISMQAGGGYADGGYLSGPGTGTSDSIPARNRQPGGAPAMFSDGEFIIPADVTSVPGMKEHFQSLINAYHKPVRR